MPDLLQLVVGLIWAGLIGAWLAYQRSAARTRVTQGRGACASCGAVIDAPPIISVTGRSELCANCFRRTRRNYRAASWLFLGLGVLFLVVSPIVVAGEYRRFGMRTAVEAAAILLGLTLLTGLPGWYLRSLGRSE